MTPTSLPRASVHGRFQPLHLSHIEYIRAAFDVADFLDIGVTQFRVHDLINVPGSGAHRADPKANPLTYFERAEMLTAALDYEGIDRTRYRITPFPIETPSSLVDFLPLEIPILTTRVDSWNDEKVRLLRGCGYTVRILYEVNPPARSATLIREMILDGNTAWVDQVPPPVFDYLVSLDLVPRLNGDDA